MSEENRLTQQVSAVLADLLSDAQRRFGETVASEVHRCADAGMIHSSSFVDRLDTLGAEEFQKRAELVYQTWERMIGAFPEDAGVLPRPVITDLVSTVLHVEAQLVSQVIMQVSPKQIAAKPRPLDEQLARSTERVLAEVAAKIATSERDTTPIAQEASEDRDHQSVFLVHGHNHGTKETVARFIEKLGLKVVILHEQPDKGQTIIEKLERHAATVGFAVVLLTADDVGGPGSDALKPRARQNVIFELGFFCSALGRRRVCALYDERVELPTDYSGVLWTPLRENWQSKLANELRVAGMSINPEALLSLSGLGDARSTHPEQPTRFFP
jgi:predicted nucleotide-binding protein